MTGTALGTPQLPIEPVVPPTTRLVGTTLGRYTELGEASYLEHVELGDYAYFGPGCFLQHCSIGKFANLSAYVRVGATRHPTERASQHHFTYRRRLFGFGDDDESFFAWRRAQWATIGHDTWLGHAAIVMPGVTVGVGAVIGAGAVVTRDVPPYAVAVGAPARVVKERFAAAVAGALLDIAWWDWSHERLAAALDDFCGPVEAFVEKHAGSRP